MCWTPCNTTSGSIGSAIPILNADVLMMSASTGSSIQFNSIYIYFHKTKQISNNFVLSWFKKQPTYFYTTCCTKIYVYRFHEDTMICII